MDVICTGQVAVGMLHLSFVEGLGWVNLAVEDDGLAGDGSNRPDDDAVVRDVDAGVHGGSNRARQSSRATVRSPVELATEEESCPDSPPAIETYRASREALARAVRELYRANAEGEVLRRALRAINKRVYLGAYLSSESLAAVENVFRDERVFIKYLDAERNKHRREVEEAAGVLSAVAGEWNGTEHRLRRQRKRKRT